ncbi:hypothetical protein CEE35_03750 [Candidatus Aerophobetes bacterium Ae_b3b]|nr:MAG: hypothetical protein CEE35_03750 [Candidatus Aerophobetes bacterium Ae_b3b]
MEFPLCPSKNSVKYLKGSVYLFSGDTQRGNERKSVSKIAAVLDTPFAISIKGAWLFWKKYSRNLRTLVEHDYPCWQSLQSLRKHLLRSLNAKICRFILPFE